MIKTGSEKILFDVIVQRINWKLKARYTCLKTNPCEKAQIRTKAVNGEEGAPSRQFMLCE